mmetsp:Transcript_7870/g.20250  ORF Transcript_7870/g.20250 Transcript_7870/m.20250 type:complete len:356 (+) Transcript_7870:217-1284(+)
MDETRGLGFAGPLVADPKLAAGRGKEFSAAHLAEQELAKIEASIAEGEDFRLPINSAPQQTLNTDGITIASYDTPIPETNPGYRMLLKMGWSSGRGLGRELQGRVDPLRGGGADGCMRFGVGKAEQDQFYTNEENVTRRKLDSEVQLEETEEQSREREAKAARQEKIKETVKEELSTFYCELCHKQYKTAMELETHLSSYDHHHKKRLIEMKQMQSERQRGDKEKREKKRVQKEMDKLNQQILRAQQRDGHPAAQPMPPLPSAPPPPPPPPSSDTGQAPADLRSDGQVPTPASTEQKPMMAFSLGAGSKPPTRGGRLGSMAMPRKAGVRPGLPMKKPGKPAAGLSAFAMDSDSDD